MSDDSSQVVDIQKRMWERTLAEGGTTLIRRFIFAVEGERAGETRPDWRTPQPELAAAVTDASNRGFPMTSNKARAANAVRDRCRAAIVRLANWGRVGSTDTALGLALCREARDGPLDTRPELLIWHFAGQTKLEPMAKAFAMQSVVGFAARHRMAIDQRHLDAAADDAVTCMRTGSFPSSADDKAKELGIRASEYRPLRRHAIQALRDAIEVGLQRFHDAMTSDGIAPVDRHSGPMDQKPSHPPVHLENDRKLDRIERMLADPSSGLDKAARADLVIAGFGVMLSKLLLDAAFARKVREFETTTTGTIQ